MKITKVYCDVCKKEFEERFSHPMKWEGHWGTAWCHIIKPLDPQIFESKIARVIEAKMDWYEYAVPTDHASNSCKFVLDGKITAISEMGIEFESFANIPAQTDLILQLDLLKELNIPSVNVRVLKSALKDKMYRVKASFVGLREGELQRIRVFCKTLMPKKAEDL